MVSNVPSEKGGLKIELEIDTIPITNSQQIQFPNAMEGETIPDLFSVEKSKRNHQLKTYGRDYIKLQKRNNFQTTSSPESNMILDAEKKLFQKFELDKSTTIMKLGGESLQLPLFALSVLISFILLVGLLFWKKRGRSDLNVG